MDSEPITYYCDRCNLDLTETEYELLLDDICPECSGGLDWF